MTSTSCRCDAAEIQAGLAPPAIDQRPAEAEYPDNPRIPDRRPSFNLHVFGLSYHTDREGARIGHLDNELNFGLGLNFESHKTAKGVCNFETGFFKDSGSRWAKFAGAGYQFNLGGRWKFDASLVAIQSTTYNDGKIFVAPLPRLLYQFDAVTVNAIYIPRVPQFNSFSVFGLFLTVPIWK